MTSDPSAESTLPPLILAQIATLQRNPLRPLLAVDADEVLFYFIRGLAGWLESRALYFDWSSFALAGNIRARGDNQPVPREALGSLLDDFFSEATAGLEPVDGAADSLARLSRHYDIVVLSNQPASAKPARELALARHGMAYPVLANSGPKGPAMAALMAANARMPAAFVDDIPSHHGSVAKHAPSARRVHFIAEPRLAPMLGKAEFSNVRLNSWAEIETDLMQFLGKAA